MQGLPLSILLCAQLLVCTRVRGICEHSYICVNFVFNVHTRVRSTSGVSLTAVFLNVNLHLHVAYRVSKAPLDYIL